jgi:alpha-D-xyloside xylohydrolase
MTRPLVSIVLALAVAGFVPGSEAADTAPPRPTPTPIGPVVLHSPALTLEVTPRSYRYKVIERATGRVLVSHADTLIRVADATPEGRGISDIQTTATTLEGRLTFANTKRSGRLRFTFTSPEVLEVRITHDQGPVTNVTEVFEDQGEHYYGIWEYQPGGLDNRGADDELLGFRDVPEINYPSARAPFYVTSRGYGIYTQSEARGRYKIAIKGQTIASFDDDHLQYSILYGPSYRDVLRRYNDLCGGSFMPPLWAFDSIWWRNDHHREWRENEVANAQELVLKDARTLQLNRIPAASMWIDRPYGTGAYGWGNIDFDQAFPDPAKMVADLEQYGMKLMVWTANRTANTLHREGKAAGYLFSDELYTDWPAVDVRQPKAYEWLKEKLDGFARLGIRGYKIDRGEEGETPDAQQNRIVTLFAKLSLEGLEAAHPGDNLVFARNVYDTGRKYAAVWNGDTVISFGGLAASVKNALRCAAINMPMWGSDIGGYHRGTVTKELFARWFQFGAYSPMMEIMIGGRRTPWLHYDDELMGIVRNQTGAHHDLIPYTRSSLHLATRTGLPVMRPLLFDHPDDAALPDLWDQYMFGPSILVAPVLQDGARARPVYLPAGRWMDYNDRKTVHDGGTTLTAAAPLDTIPLYVHEGAIVPRGDILKSNNGWQLHWRPYLRVEVFAARSGRHAFEYFTGSDVQTIASEVSGRTMTLDVGDLKTRGILEIHVKGVDKVLKNGQELPEGDGRSYDPERQVLTVTMDGPMKITLEGLESLF